MAVRGGTRILSPKLVRQTEGHGRVITQKVNTYVHISHISMLTASQCGVIAFSSLIWRWNKFGRPDMRHRENQYINWSISTLLYKEDDNVKFFQIFKLPNKKKLITLFFFWTFFREICYFIIFVKFFHKNSSNFVFELELWSSY